MKNGFYVIEGVCCAGKTSLLNLMKMRGMYVIPETNKMVSHFPPFPTNYYEARMNEKFILGIEIQRSLVGRENSNMEIRFADRLLPSVLAISYANQIVKGFDTMNELLEDVIEYIIKYPDSFSCDAHIYFKVELDTVLKRNSCRTNPLSSTWVSKEIIEPQIRFYDLYAAIVKSANFLTLNVDGMTTEEIGEKILGLDIAKVNVPKEQMVEEFRQLQKAL